MFSMFFTYISTFIWHLTKILKKLKVFNWGVHQVLEHEHLYFCVKLLFYKLKTGTTELWLFFKTSKKPVILISDIEVIKFCPYRHHVQFCLLYLFIFCPYQKFMLTQYLLVFVTTEKKFWSALCFNNKLILSVLINRYSLLTENKEWPSSRWVSEVALLLRKESLLYDFLFPTRKL